MRTALIYLWGESISHKMIIHKQAAIIPGRRFVQNQRQHLVSTAIGWRARTRHNSKNHHRKSGNLLTIFSSHYTGFAIGTERARHDSNGRQHHRLLQIHHQNWAYINTRLSEALIKVLITTWLLHALEKGPIAHIDW